MGSSLESARHFPNEMVDQRLRRSAAHVLLDDLVDPVLDADADHHLRRVLRLRDGQSVTVTDGSGRWRDCRWSDDGLVAVSEVVEGGTARGITIGVAIPKQDRPEWMVTKLVECGVDRIVLLDCERSVVRWSADRVVRNLDRLNRVARSAMEQSRRIHMCVIEGPVPASAFLPEALIAEPGGRRLVSGDTTVAIGPEGGWSDKEVASAQTSIELADTVLRVETAALAAAVTMAGLSR